MATVLGTVATAVAAGGLSNKQLSGLIDGRVKANIDTYVAVGTEASGTVIKVGSVLATGANVIAVLVVGSAASAALTVSVGDGGSGTRYVSASTAFQSAAASLLAALGAGYIVTGSGGDGQIQLTTGGATLAAITLTVITLYTLD